MNFQYCAHGSFLSQDGQSWMGAAAHFQTDQLSFERLGIIQAVAFDLSEVKLQKTGVVLKHFKHQHIPLAFQNREDRIGTNHKYPTV